MSKHIRHRLWLRLVLAVAAVAVYVIVALVLAATIPESGWPGIGDAEFSSRQATIVPALNVYALAVILLALFEPVTTAVARIVVTVVVAVIAAATGPLLAVLGEGVEASGPLAPGVIALAVAGIVVGSARVWAARRLTSLSQ
jgi:hypothetical protein